MPFKKKTKLFEHIEEDLSDDIFFLSITGRPSRKSDNNLLQKMDKSQFETPLNTSTQVEITSSGRRRIRPLKFNDFADIKPKSASNENLVLRHPQQELETPVKESRRRRGTREVTDAGSPIKELNETKRTRLHASATKLENDERPSKRKISLNEEENDITVTKKQRKLRESSELISTPTVQRRGRSITSNADVKDDISPQPEKSHKRRRTAPIHLVEQQNSLEHIQIKEEPCATQSELTRYGKYVASVDKPRRESRSTTAIQSPIKTEEIEAAAAAPQRRGRRPKQQIVVESDTQSESTDAGRRFSSVRSQRTGNRNEIDYQKERRSSRNINLQEHPNSPLTGASTEPSGDECLRMVDKKSGRRHSRRSRGQSTNDQEIMQPPIVTENHSEDDIDSIVEDEPLITRKPKPILADIFTKAAGKRGKRKRSSPIMQSKLHGHRTSNRIAAAAAIAKRQQSPSSEHSAGTSTPHHSHGATSSDDQQTTSKKQMTLPEMMKLQKAKNIAAESRYVLLLSI